MFKRDLEASITPNTFLVWEPCSQSHAEVVPGYSKYLVDLGFEVLVLLTPSRYNKGLFSRIVEPRITLKEMSQRSIKRYLRRNGLAKARGIIITSHGKISKGGTIDCLPEFFGERSMNQKILLVEHDVRAPIENGSISENALTLRRIEYRGVATNGVNPHYFGNVKSTPKNPGIVNFVSVGALRKRRRNAQLLVDAVKKLHHEGIRNFKITVIGRGSMLRIPSNLRTYFDLKGRLNFSEMYHELESADFFLPLLDVEDPRHERYITTATSGSFQLIYGFSKPCLVARKFAQLNEINDDNSLVYSNNCDFARTMLKAIAMPSDEYDSMQRALKKSAESIYAESLENLRKSIDSQ